MIDGLKCHSTPVDSYSVVRFVSISDVSFRSRGKIQPMLAPHATQVFTLIVDKPDRYSSLAMDREAHPQPSS